MHPTIVAETIASLEELGGKAVRDPETDLITINGELTASLVLARCVRSEAGDHQWTIRVDASLSQRHYPPNLLGYNRLRRTVVVKSLITSFSYFD
jgi:hypothetical protein